MIEEKLATLAAFKKETLRHLVDTFNGLVVRNFAPSPVSVIDHTKNPGDDFE